MAEAQAKICVCCKQDCSKKPRTKDLQGNYTCRACYDKLQAAAQARKAQAAAAAGALEAPPVLDDDAAVLSALLDSEPASTEPCPACTALLPPNGTICLSCGFNTATGSQMKTKAIKAPRQRVNREPGKAVEILTSPLVIFVGLTAVYFSIHLVDAENPLILLPLLGLLIASVGTLIYEIYAAFADGYKGWGICAICQIIPCVGLICFLAMLYYVFAINGRARLMAAVGASLLGGISLFIFNVRHTELGF